MKKLLLYMGCAVAMLSACDPNDDFIDTLNSEAKAAGVDMPEALTLEEGDYSIVEKSDMFASKDEAANLIPQILTSKYAANSSNDGDLMNIFYQLDGSAFFADLYSSDQEYTLQEEDYTDDFGLKYPNFSSISGLDKYAPVFLKDKYKYSQKAGDELALGFVLRANMDQYHEYKFDGTVWVKTEKTNSDFDVVNAYELSKEDYDSMGTEKYQPGEKDNFSYKMNVEEYLVAFLATRYPSAVTDEIVTVKFKYYDNNEAKVVYNYDGNNWALKGSVRYDWSKGDYLITDITLDADDKFVFKAKTGWEVIIITTYEFTDEDYALTGDDKYKNISSYDDKAGTYKDVEVDNILHAKINEVLAVHFPDAAEGALFEVTYKYYTGTLSIVKARYQKTGDKFILVEEE